MAGEGADLTRLFLLEAILILGLIGLAKRETSTNWRWRNGPGF